MVIKEIGFSLGLNVICGAEDKPCSEGNADG